MGTKSKSKKKRKGNDDEPVQLGTDHLPIDNQPAEQPPLNVKVEVIHERTDRTPPIVGYFPSRYDPLEQTPASMPNVKFYRNAERVKIEKTEKRKGSERLELVVRPPECNVEFVGKSYKGEAMAAQMCTYALGVLDKDTQTLKIMPIAGNKIFRLEPKIRGLDTADKEPVVENVEISEQERLDKRRKTTLLYSSKKSIKEDKRRQTLKQADDDAQDEIKNVPVNKQALESTSAHIARNIPPHNTSATTPQEAYPLDRIIHGGEWDFLEDFSQNLQAGAEVTDSAYPTFVCNRIHKLQSIQDEEKRNTLSCIFSYITHLIKFKDMHSLHMSSAKNHRLPSILRQRFFEMFNPESRRFSEEKIGLLISYVLVLSLHADEFRSDPADIAKDLRMSSIKLRDHFKNLGCKLAMENKIMMATLPVPLEFPQLRLKRRR